MSFYNSESSWASERFILVILKHEKHACIYTHEHMHTYMHACIHECKYVCMHAKVHLPGCTLMDNNLHMLVSLNPQFPNRHLKNHFAGIIFKICPHFKMCPRWPPKWFTSLELYCLDSSFLRHLLFPWKALSVSCLIMQIWEKCDEPASSPKAKSNLPSPPRRLLIT